MPRSHQPSPTPSRGRHNRMVCATAATNRHLWETSNRFPLPARQGFTSSDQGFNRSVRSLFHQAKLGERASSGQPSRQQNPLRLRGPILIALAASRGVKRCSSTGNGFDIEKDHSRQADCSRAIPSQVGKSFVREATEMESRHYSPFTAKEPSLVTIMKMNSDAEGFMSTPSLPVRGAQG